MAIEKLIKTNAEWKKILTPEQYHILREKGTEAPGSCAFSIKQEGTFYCVACGNPLFIAGKKFESHTGWPSFFEPYAKDSIIFKPDDTDGMIRTEVICARCEGHLGHVFDDGPPPTHKRFCINGIVLKFIKNDNGN
jgi:methionine-R-sulfoxide reductase